MSQTIYIYQSKSSGVFTSDTLFDDHTCVQHAWIFLTSINFDCEALSEDEHKTALINLKSSILRKEKSELLKRLEEVEEQLAA